MFMKHPQKGVKAKCRRVQLVTHTLVCIIEIYERKLLPDFRRTLVNRSSDVWLEQGAQCSRGVICGVSD